MSVTRYAGGRLVLLAGPSQDASRVTSGGDRTIAGTPRSTDGRDMRWRGARRRRRSLPGAEGKETSYTRGGRRTSQVGHRPTRRPAEGESEGDVRGSRPRGNSRTPTDRSMRGCVLPPLCGRPARTGPVVPSGADDPRRRSDAERDYPESDGARREYSNGRRVLGDDCETHGRPRLENGKRAPSRGDGQSTTSGHSPNLNSDEEDFSAEDSRGRLRVNATINSSEWSIPHGSNNETFKNCAALPPDPVAADLRGRDPLPAGHPRGESGFSESDGGTELKRCNNRTTLSRFDSRSFSF
ncbi:hypothetical protein THAOC_35161 [Thalassiosira oceanica]|uniref:Uncharacterized protein n=1 Tax=Thalassiosira oceanica TaxID=159749 RepID=K0R2B7_THAOC|nr:hypothetical protein THAOC_35161 [Thalassiosira oceanica]|eukprot:EJK46185.1 hypothetical protein THAOC_35161 [Thalassiosira oceanica]